MRQLTFNPGLTLTGFRTTRPCMISSLRARGFQCDIAAHCSARLGGRRYLVRSGLSVTTTGILIELNEKQYPKHCYPEIEEGKHWMIWLNPICSFIALIY